VKIEYSQIGCGHAFFDCCRDYQGIVSSVAIIVEAKFKAAYDAVSQRKDFQSWEQTIIGMHCQRILNIVRFHHLSSVERPDPLSNLSKTSVGPHAIVTPELDLIEPLFILK
jgi:hypothetical protein